MTDVSGTDGNTYGYFMRVQRIEEYADKIRALGLVEDYTKILCVAHRGTNKDPNPHYHLIIETQVKDKAFWKRMTKIFNKGKGNSNASHVPWDGKIDACSYMFHEDDDDANIVLSKGFTDSDILRMKQVNSEVKARINDAANGSYTDKQLAKHKKTVWDVIMEVRMLMPSFEDGYGNTRFRGRMNIAGDTELPEETAYAILIEVLEKYKIRTAEHELKRWLDTILRIDPCADAMKKNILSRYKERNAS